MELLRYAYATLYRVPNLHCRGKYYAAAALYPRHLRTSVQLPKLTLPHTWHSRNVPTSEIVSKLALTET